MGKRVKDIVMSGGEGLHPVAEALFCLGLLLKPLYILPSGSLQLGDLALVFSFVALVVGAGLRFRINPGDFRYLFFVACVVFINGLYYCQYRTADFLFQTMYYAFNFLTIVTFRELMRSTRFLWLSTQALRLDVYLQVLIYVAGLGRWYAGGTDRYMGSFNDPNQLAFFIFCAFIFIEIVSTKKRFRKSALDVLAALFVIVQTASTGMLLGFCLLLIPLVFRGFKRFFSMRRIPRAAPVAIGIVFIVAVSFAVGVGPKIDSSALVVERLEGKIRKVIGSDQGGNNFQTSILVDRQVDKLILYPECLLYGAGQGDFARFTQASGTNEVHSTLPGILFYYGMFPFVILMSWIIGNFLRAPMSAEIALMFCAFLLESCTLANQRQPLFWIIIMLASLEWRELPADPSERRLAPRPIAGTRGERLACSH